jgi:hypothetical protein
MRRGLQLALLLVLMSGSPTFAQDGGIGVKGGVNFATQQLTGTGAPSPTMRIAAVVGGFVTLPLSSWLSVQGEGLYTMKGAKITVSGIESTLQLDYLEVPVLARVRLGSGHRHYYVAGGVAPAFRLRARAATTFSSSTEEIDVADQVERFDLGVVAGGGMQAGALVFDARYTFGIRDIDTDKSDNSHTKNRAVTVTAGFRF